MISKICTNKLISIIILIIPFVFCSFSDDNEDCDVWQNVQAQYFPVITSNSQELIFISSIELQQNIPITIAGGGMNQIYQNLLDTIDLYGIYFIDKKYSYKEVQESIRQEEVVYICENDKKELKTLYRWMYIFTIVDSDIRVVLPTHNFICLSAPLQPKCPYNLCDNNLCQTCKPIELKSNEQYCGQNETEVQLTTNYKCKQSIMKYKTINDKKVVDGNCYEQLTPCITKQTYIDKISLSELICQINTDQSTCKYTERKDLLYYICCDINPFAARICLTIFQLKVCHLMIILFMLV